METLFIPNENDVKRWIKEALDDSLKNRPGSVTNSENAEDLLNRVEISKLLRVSLVTLTDWMKRGLPSHKQRGRVYFMKSEVLDYIKENKMKQLKFGSRYQHLRSDMG